MDQAFKSYKRKFKNNLEPLLVMLINKKPDMTLDQWQDYVARTRQRVIRNPHEFLGKDLPDDELVEDIVCAIFSTVQTGK